MKCIIILIIVIFIQYNSYGQIASEGVPLYYSLSQGVEAPVLILPDINVKKLIREDKKVIPTRNKALRFAKIINLDIDPKHDGIWSTLSNGDKIWYMHVKSPNAHSLGLFFDNYRLPPGAKLFVYSPDKKHVRGAFTYKNNKWNNILALAPIKGDEIIIEYFEPQDVIFKGEIHISSIAHDYKNIFSLTSKRTKAYGSSGACNVNVNCDNDDLIQLLKHSVCKITYNGWLCSGALINNTKNDGHPYFLTANHCINNSFDANAALFYFNYESPGCTNIDGPIDQTISGSVIIATPEIKTLDFSLLELSVTPPPSYQPYYAGWNRNIVDPASVFSIHHPSGDIKKLTKSTTGATTSDYGEDYTEFTHWWINEWDEGTTEGGSSGAPLFNGNGEIIGDLTGGDASCSFNYNDYYLQFHHAWKDFSDSTKKLEPWLDPANSKTLSLNGYLPYDTIPTNLYASLVDTTINLKWNETQNSANVEYYYVYRDSVKFDSTTTTVFSDTLAYKDSVYSYWVTAFYKNPTEYETEASNIIFIRMMDSLSLPFGEDFESQFSIPDYWYEERSLDSVGWEFKTGGFAGIIDTAYEGSVNAYYKNDSGEISRLVLPRFNLASYSNALLSFYLNMQALNNDVHNLNILYKDADSTNWKVIRTYDTYYPEWEKQNIPLPNLTNNYQIAFEGIGLGGFGICLDSISLIEDMNYIEPVFDLNKDSICLYDSIEFSTTLDGSYDLKWDFGENAIYDTLYGPGPHWIKYSSNGIKQIKLTVNNTYTKIITDTVKVFAFPNASFTANQDILTSSSLHGNQWYLNGKVINGETDTIYTVTENGNYHVEVTNSFNCVSVSESQYIIVDNVEEIFIEEEFNNNNKEAIIVLPNPNDGGFRIQFNLDDKISKFDYNIVDITGKIIKTGILNSTKRNDIKLINPISGIYFIHIYTSNNYYTTKILIKK